METKMIGNKIAEARKKVNISQAQLAERLFISPQAVGKWERGESMPDIITFNRMAEILGVDLNYFSENFPSTAATLASADSIAPLLGESSSVKQNHSESKAGRKPSWDMSNGNWVDADFSGLKNLHEKFSSSNMQRCKFIGSDLSELLLNSNYVDVCDFSGSDISNSHIKNSHLVNNLFKDCSLKEAEISGSHIKSCNFSGADFTGATIKSSAFQKNTIADAKWNCTSFNATHLANIVFNGIIEDCNFENSAFYRVTFQNSMLINTFFKCKSLKGILFVDCQADRMTYEFLKNGKADLSGITLLTP
ncbi:MAG: helix-turn-helix domain-containing protein [Candidatus Saccharibacteria bacterium]